MRCGSIAAAVKIIMQTLLRCAIFNPLSWQTAVNLALSCRSLRNLARLHALSRCHLRGRCALDCPVWRCVVLLVGFIVVLALLQTSVMLACDSTAWLCRCCLRLLLLLLPGL